MSAIISDCGKYRYALNRPKGRIEPGAVLWVMLNPSTADADIDDPTISRCIGYTRNWGYDSFSVGNLYAYRATDPKALWSADVDIRGTENDGHLCRMAARAELIVVAWGGFADPARARSVASLLTGFAPIHCIGTTKDGQPWHPLYKSKDLRPVQYSTAQRDSES